MSDLSNIDSGVSAFGSKTSRAAAYTKIQQEIDATEGEATIQLWKERHNNLSSIARLPPELLSDIFLLKALAEREDSSSLDWIRVSHVCAHWRCVALECPAFWSYLPCTHLTLMIEMLKRSKQAPLTVVATLSQSPRNFTTYSTIRSVLSHLLRIRELTLFHDPRDPPGLFKNLLADLRAPAPLLETLSITLNVHDGESSLSDTILENSPRLRHLVLECCGLNWTSPLPCALVNFTFLNPPPTYQPSMDQLLIAVEKLPALTTLKLRDAFIADRLNNSALTRKPVHLPSLATLEISSSLDSCIAFLNRLDYPRTANISVRCWLSLTAMPLLSDFGALLDKRMERTRCAVIEERIRNVRYDLKLWSDPGTHLSPPTTTPNTSLTTTSTEFRNHPYAFIFEAFRAIRQGLPMQDVQTLHFCGSVSKPQREAWLETFSSLPSLNTIRVVGRADGVVAALALSLPSQEGPPRPAKFSALRHLVCEDIACPACNTDDHAYYEALIACEKERSMLHGPFHVSFVCLTCGPSRGEPNGFEMMYWF